MAKMDLYNVRWKNFRTSFFYELQNLFQMDLLTDINLVLPDGCIPCHKMVLATTSIYFRDIFIKNPNITEMTLNWVNAKQMRILLEYMYHGEVQMKTSEMPKLLKVAGYLKIQGLTCEEEYVTCDRTYQTPVEGMEKLQIKEEPQDGNVNVEMMENMKLASPVPENAVETIKPANTVMWPISTLESYSKHIIEYCQTFPNIPGLKEYAAALTALRYWQTENQLAASRNIVELNGQEERRSSSSSPVDNKFEPVPSTSGTAYQDNNNKKPRGKQNQNEDAKPKKPYFKHKKELLQRFFDPKTPARTGRQRVDWKRYKQYSPEDLCKAIECVIEGQMSALRASQVFSVPSRTLYDKIKRLKNADQKLQQKCTPKTTRQSPRSRENDSARFPTGIGRNINGMIYDRNYSVSNGSLESTGENSEIENSANVNVTNSPDGSGSPPSWPQQVNGTDVNGNSEVEAKKSEDENQIQDLSVKKPSDNDKGNDKM